MKIIEESFLLIDGQGEDGKTYTYILGRDLTDEQVERLQQMYSNDKDKDGVLIQKKEGEWVAVYQATPHKNQNM